MYLHTPEKETGSTDFSITLQAEPPPPHSSLRNRGSPSLMSTCGSKLHARVRRGGGSSPLLLTWMSAWKHGKALPLHTSGHTQSKAKGAQADLISLNSQMF